MNGDIELTAKGVETLLRMVEKSRKVSEKSNEQLAEGLVALTSDLTIDSYHYQFLMECAYRLAPEVFENA